MTNCSLPAVIEGTVYRLCKDHAEELISELSLFKAKILLVVEGGTPS